MPNHITTRIRVTGPKDKVEEFFDRTMTDVFGDGDLRFDFRTVVPQPPEVLKSIEDNGKTGEELFPLWYHWNCDHWGTKWNNYGPYSERGYIKPASDGGSEAELVFGLTTAWSFPEPILLACARQFRELKFHAWFADEDIGHNCGEFTAEWQGDGSEVVSSFTDREGDYKFACEVTGHDYDEWKKDYDEWKRENDGWNGERTAPSKLRYNNETGEFEKEP